MLINYQGYKVKTEGKNLKVKFQTRTRIRVVETRNRSALNRQ